MIEREQPATTSDEPADYATLVGQWLSETIPVVEAALHDGNLNELLQLPDIREVLGGNLGKFYYFLAKIQTKPEATFRKDWIAAFLQEFQQSLQPPKAFFASHCGKRLRSPVAQPPSITIVHEKKEIVLRHDQVLSARAWGIWFNFSDELLERVYLAALVRSAVSRLASQIKLLTTIQTSGVSTEKSLSASEWHKHSQFRRLLIDVFNESELLASERLDDSEDLLSFPVIKLTSDTHLHVFSDANIQAPVVTSGTPVKGKRLIISPWELSRSAISEIAASRSKTECFWSSWADDVEVSAISEQLTLLFADAIELPPVHPLGAISHLPAQIRERIRAFPDWKAHGPKPIHWVTQTESQRHAAYGPTSDPRQLADVQVTASCISEAIKGVEAALLEGTLSQRIEEPELQKVIGPLLTQRYRAMSVEKIQHSKEFRTNWITRLTTLFQQRVQPPVRTFRAKAKSLWTAGDPAPPVLEIIEGPESIALRPDQVLSARRWGTWFVFKDAELDRIYHDYLLYRAVNDLTSDIKSLWSLESTYLSGFSTLRPDVIWQAGRRAGWFERLVIDILNEETLVAQPAPLAEDMLEKTDLRVLYPNSNRKRGTRVQVSLTSDPEWHERKVESLLVPEEFVLLTPLDCARAAVHPPGHPLFDDFAWNEFWTSLDGPKNVHDLALQLHTLFEDALSFPPRHPLGPMWHIPAPLRRFIRIYTQQRAEKVALTENSRRSDQLINVAHRYSGSYWKQKFAQTSPGK